jgi:hypothetical protein
MRSSGSSRAAAVVFALILAHLQNPVFNLLIFSAADEPLPTHSPMP